MNIDLKKPPDLQGDTKKLPPSTSAECEGSTFPKVKSSRSLSWPLGHIHSERILRADAGKKMIHKSWTGEPETRLCSSTSGESEYSIAAMKSQLDNNKLDDQYLRTTSAKDTSHDPKAENTSQKKLMEKNLKNDLNESAEHKEKQKEDAHDTFRTYAIIQQPEDLDEMLATNLIEYDENCCLSEDIAQLKFVYGLFCKLVQQERDVAKHAQQHCAKVQDGLLCDKLDSDQLLNQTLINQVNNLQWLQESLMVKHAKKCLLAEERIHRLESEAESLDAEKRENATLITRLEEYISGLKSTIKDTDEKLWLQGEEMRNAIREYKRKADSLIEQLKDRDNCLYKQKEEADEGIREVERKSEQKLARVREEARQQARQLEDRHGQQIRTLMRVIPMPHAPVHRHNRAIQVFIALVLLILEGFVLYHGGETNPILQQVIFVTTLLDLGWEYWLERRVGVGSILAIFLAAREVVGNILPLPIFVAAYVVGIRLLDLAVDYNL